MNFVKKCVCVFLFSLSMAIIFAEYNSFGIPDSAEIRKSLPREWFEGPLSAIRSLGSPVYKNSIGIEFQLRLEEQDDAFIVIVAPKSKGTHTVHDASGVHVVNEGLFNAGGAGSWLLVRDKKDGNPISIRYYFAKDSEVFIQFRPNKKAFGQETTFVDLIIFDSYAARAVPLGLPFSKFYTASFAEIQALTKKTVPWNSVVPSWEGYVVEQQKLEKENSKLAKPKNAKRVPNPARIYDDILVMVNTIRENLSDIVYVEDAIYDENGNPITLEKGLPRVVAKEHEDKITVCSQGFVKWIVDGIIEPLTGSYLMREPLLQETIELAPTSYQGAMSARYNTYSSLDWTRNIAASALSAVSRRNVFYKDSGVDVTVEPFAAMVTEKGVMNTVGYVKNSGYKIRYIKQLLYVLAATNPDYFYLAAIRQSDSESKIETKVFNDCAAIFPYFDNNGAFKAVVFYDGVEYTLEDFCDNCYAKRGADLFIHLVRVKSTRKYYPQLPKKQTDN